MKVRVLIMAKSPIPGKVKTRLKLQPGQAARLQEAFLQDVVAKAIKLGSVTVAVTPPEHLGFMQSLLPEGIALIPQVDGDIGDRMLAAADKLFLDAPGPVLILGTDAPTLPVDYLVRAADVLDAYDASIVPSIDGGYVLLGLNAPHGELFSGIDWSTERVYRQTADRAQQADVKLFTLDTWYDVDTPADLERLHGDLEQDSLIAPRTSDVLAQIFKQ